MENYKTKTSFVIPEWQKAQAYNGKVKIFFVRFRNRMISAGLELVLSRTEKLCIALCIISSCT